MTDRIQPTPPRDPLDDARALLRDMPPADDGAAARLKSALARLGPSGRLADTALWLAAWPGPSGPRAGRVLRPILSIYVSAYATDPQASARGRATLEHLAAGGGPMSALAQSQGAGVEVFDLGIERPALSPDDAPQGVMSAREAAATVAFGMEALAKSPDLLVLADATEGASAIARALAIRLAQGPGDALTSLRMHAGREVAAVAGAIMAARRQRTPVILDGDVAVAAAAVLAAQDQDAVAHCRVAGATAMSIRLGLIPLCDIGDDLAPGLGGACAAAFSRLAGELAAAADA